MEDGRWKMEDGGRYSLGGSGVGTTQALQRFVFTALDDEGEYQQNSVLRLRLAIHAMAFLSAPPQF